MNKRLFPVDLGITLPTIFLISLGILVLFSADPKLAIQQTWVAIAGLILYYLISYLDFNFYQDYIKYLYLFALLLLIIVFIIGFETRGSIRWIPLGIFQFQPSEFIKPIIVLLLAKFWSDRQTSWLNIVLSFLIISPAVFLIFKQPDLGTMLTVIAIWFVMIIGANISFKKILLMALGLLLIIPFGWFFLRDYQKYRLMSFLWPEKDPLGIGYNAIQSTIAVGSGELLGRGLGRGTQSRLQFLPEFRTDFIFASIAEEFGLLGCALLLILYGWIIARALMIMDKTKNRFNSLLIIGVLGMLFFQITVNIGMNIGILPITGITLPLLSYGGSSLFVTLISLGIICSVSRQERKSAREEMI